MDPFSGSEKMEKTVSLKWSSHVLVTRWRGGKKGGQNRVCACDTRDRGVNKKLKPEHPSETVVMPESGERKRNLTTLVLVKNAVKRSRSRQKVSESSQNPLSSSRRRERARQGRSNVQLAHSCHPPSAQ